MIAVCRYIRLILPWALYVRLLIFGAALTWMWSTTRWSVSSPLNSALLSAFFKSCSKNSADFLGHLPWQAPHCLHYQKESKYIFSEQTLHSVAFFLHRGGFQTQHLPKNCMSDWPQQVNLAYPIYLMNPFPWVGFKIGRASCRERV